MIIVRFIFFSFGISLLRRTHKAAARRMTKHQLFLLPTRELLLQVLNAIHGSIFQKKSHMICFVEVAF